MVNNGTVVKSPVKNKKPQIKQRYSPPPSGFKYPPPKQELIRGNTDVAFVTNLMGVHVEPASDKLGRNREAIVTDASFYGKGNGTVTRRDDRVVRRAVAWHERPPDLIQALEKTDFSVLLPVVPLNRRPFDIQQDKVRWNTHQNDRWQRAVRSFAFPRRMPSFGRYSVTWGKADQMIAFNEFDETAAAGGHVVTCDQYASLAHATIVGGPLNLRKREGDPVVSAYPEGLLFFNDKVVLGDRAWAYWKGKIDINSLGKLLVFPFTVYLYNEQEGNDPYDEEQPMYVTCILRAEVDMDNGVADFTDYSRALKFVPPCDWERITGTAVLDSFQAMIPGAPPPVDPLYFRRHSVAYPLQFLKSLVANVHVGHSLGGNIVVGRDYYTRLPVYATFDSTWASIASLNKSKSGKTTLLQFYFLQCAQWPIFVALSAAKDESAPGWVDDFGGKAWFLDNLPDAETKKEQLALMKSDQKRAISYAKDLIKDWLNGVLTDLPLVIYPRVATMRYYNMVYYFLAELRKGWAEMAAGTPDLLEIFLDNLVSLLNIPYIKEWEDLTEDLKKLWHSLVRDYLDNGANEHMRLWYTAHTEKEFSDWAASGILEGTSTVIRPFYELDEDGRETDVRLVEFLDPTEGIAHDYKKHRLPVLLAELPAGILEFVAKSINLG